MKLSKIIDNITYNGELYEFADNKARERLNDVEYQTVITELAFEHTSLPIGEKTVTVQGDDSWGDTVYISSGADLVPRTTFNRKFPYNGITVEKNGYTYHLSGTATTASGIYLTHVLNDYKSENIRGLGGQTLKLVAFSDAVFDNDVRIFMQFYDENKTDLSGQIKHAIFKTSTVGTADIVVPENAVYMGIWIQIASGVVLDNDIQVYLNVAEKTQSSSDFNNIAINDDESTYVMSFPYESIVSVKVSIGEYIDYMTANAKGDTATYLTPEAFGAVGDGYADDINAITDCLKMANATKQAVFMAKKYLISAPIDINGNDFNIIINDIIYNGTDVTVKIHGQRNTIKIHSVTSSGVGIKFLGDGAKDTLYNDLEINTITASSHGIIFESVSAALYQNTVRFNLVKAGGDGCYGIAYVFGENGTFITENNFYGGNITNCDWACYKVAGNSRLMNIQVEGNVKGGFYITGYVSIVKPRWGESNRDGEYPFLKFACDINQSKYIQIDNNVPLPINEIDLSDNSDIGNNASGTEHPLYESYLAILNFPIHSPSLGVGLGAQSSIDYTHKAYVWGKYLIMTPFMAYRKEVTTATLDTRLIGQAKTEAEIRELSQLPTKFVINTVNTDIYLHESYCAFGFNEFEVEQMDGFTCKIYDKLNNLIFDGTEQGDGLYKLNVYKDAAYCINKSSGSLRCDFTGHYWTVEKQVSVSDVLNALPVWSGGAY